MWNKELPDQLMKVNKAVIRSQARGKAFEYFRPNHTGLLTDYARVTLEEKVAIHE